MLILFKQPLIFLANKNGIFCVPSFLFFSVILSFLFQNGQTALSIAQRLGYISVVETLKVVTEKEVTTTTTTTVEEKYRVIAPESMQETFMSDSEDEGGKVDDTTNEQQKYTEVL